jgi:S-adenosylmethionine:tRNA ribosyltransferase-isomerase
MKHISIKDFTYTLPHEKIAEFPLDQRDASRLLVYKEGVISDDQFANLPGFLHEGQTLVLNNTRVMEARIFFQKPTGGLIEIFCLEPYENNVETALAQTGHVYYKCFIGGASKWKKGQVLQKSLNEEATATLEARYVDKLGDSFVIRFDWTPPHLSFADVLQKAGAIPLPPYIKRNVSPQDAERYQTVFNKETGSVAAPTAALHFTPQVLQHLSEKKVGISYVTLHVGAGTFKPVKSETIGEHQMHSEPFSITRHSLQQVLDAKEIIAVGTTSLRTLESLYWMGIKLMNGLQDAWYLEQWEAYELTDKMISYRDSFGGIFHWMASNCVSEIKCRTSLIIVPGYSFRVSKGLVTNFHQPGSTLLLLVAAFVKNDWKKIYEHALAHDYRFLSYGDSSLLWRQD